jgi:tetratricopeptide (TPR) repeat protein
LAAITVLVFLPILGNGFVDWDDQWNFLGNPHYRGLGWTHLQWMATESFKGHYVPVAWITLALDYVLWGMNPFGYHLTSLAIHAAATALFCVVARELIRRAVRVSDVAATTGAAGAALLFGLHPLRVESVAWVTERRDVLSGFFFLLTVLLYVRSTASAGARRGWLLGGSVVAHLAALLSKSIAITAPVILVILDVYPLRRLPPDRDRWVSRPTARVLAEKLPHLALSGAQALLTYYFFHMDLSIGRILSWRETLARVLSSLWFYPVKTLAPLDLSPLYESRPGLALTDPLVLRAAAGFVLVTALAWLARRRCPGVAAAWAAYVIMLLPVSGAVSLGFHLTADRYSYLPCMGFAVLAGGGIAAALAASARRPDLGWLTPVALGVTVTAIVSLGVLTSRQTRVWHDTVSLWEHAIRATPACVVCRINLAVARLRSREPDAAVAHLQHALMLRPAHAELYRGIGVPLDALGRRDEAITAYRQGLAVDPRDLRLRMLLANALLASDHPDEAVGVLEEAWRFYTARAMVAYFEDVRRRQPDSALGQFGLARAWWILGERERARGELDALRRLNPDLARRAEAGLEPS